ncbi:polysaccharide biosynthesis tyrosine autokinase [Brevibacterium aurantiacum]|nr:polysaccharide biosynthesis tyrosine autokinase [Brevibacterium aurantiacum]
MERTKTMGLSHQAARIARFWRSALLIFLLSLGVSAGLTSLQTPVYTAASTMYITVGAGESAGELSDGASYAEDQVSSYMRLALTEEVLAPVLERLDLNLTPAELAEQLVVSSPDATTMIEVSANSEDPKEAMRLSHEVAVSLIDTILDLSPKEARKSGIVNATLVTDATLPLYPSSPRPVVNLAVAAAIGLFLGLAQGLARSYFDTRVRGVEDLESLSTVPILGEVRRLDAGRARGSVRARNEWAYRESIRKLRTNFGFVDLGGSRRRSTVITSALSGEGKTSVAVNLAWSLTAAGHSVLLIDADLRQPQIASRLSVDSELGLCEILMNRGKLSDFVVRMYPHRLNVLAAGSLPPNPAELLGSVAWSHLLSEAERSYDYVLVDSPPLLPVSDAVIMAARAGGAILVARSGKVRVPQFKSALQALQNASVTPLGFVLNAVKPSGAREYAYYMEPVRRQQGRRRLRRSGGSRADG